MVRQEKGSDDAYIPLGVRVVRARSKGGRWTGDIEDMGYSGLHCVPAASGVMVSAAGEPMRRKK